MLSAEVAPQTQLDMQGVSRGINRWLEDGAARGFDEATTRVPVDRGTLLQSGVQPGWDNNRVIWGFNADHAEAVEKGTGPRTPPIEALKEWGRRVLGSREAGASVWQKIREVGQSAQPYVKPAIEAQIRWYRTNDFSQYTNRELNR